MEPSDAKLETPQSDNVGDGMKKNQGLTRSSSRISSTGDGGGFPLLRTYLSKSELLSAVERGGELDMLAACLEGGKERLLKSLRSHEALVNPKPNLETNWRSHEALVMAKGDVGAEGVEAYLGGCVCCEGFVEAVQDIAGRYMEEIHHET